MEFSHKENKEIRYKLNCYYTNADSLINKRHEFEISITNTTPDLICITELLPKNNTIAIDSSIFTINGYNCITNIDDKSCKRGLAIYTKNSIETTRITSDHHNTLIESIWCEVYTNKSDKLLVGCIYLSPNSSTENNSVLNNVILQTSQEHRNLLLVGDFNFPEIDWALQLANVPSSHKA